MNFMFSCFKEYWAYWLSFMIMIFTSYLYTHIYCLLMYYFHESYLCLIDLSVLISCGFLISWKTICFYSLLEGFRTSLQTFHITSYGILHMVEFSNTFFSNLFLKTPTFHGRMDGRSCSCMLYIENHFKLEHDWVVVIWVILWYYCCFNWYHWILSIKSIHKHGRPSIRPWMVGVFKNRYENKVCLKNSTKWRIS